MCVMKKYRIEHPLLIQVEPISLFLYQVIQKIMESEVSGYFFKDERPKIE